MNLNTPIENIPRIGPKYQKKLNRLGIKTVSDLLFHLPHRYEDFSNLKKISQVKPDEKVCVQGKISEIRNIITRKRRMIFTKAAVEDDSGKMNVIWFNQPYLIDTLKPGTSVCLAGKAVLNKKYFSSAYLSSPIHERLLEKEKALIHTGGLIPIYPETEGLSSRWLRYILRPLLARFKNTIHDPIPQEIQRQNNLMPISRALWQIHFPDSKELAEKARERFSFQEIFLIQLSVLTEKLRLKQKKAQVIPLDLDTTKQFVNSLPFKLTDAQRKSSWQVLKDMEKPRPMNRLLEGDVGSGKTIVATMAALNASQASQQTAFMVPTEILAEQHFKNINNALKSFKVKTGLLTGKTCKISNRKTTKKALLEKVKKGEIDILIGTHALIQEKVRFSNLALVVLDEQHRFGVEQRATLCQQKETIPHLLSMSATPIPRTLALTIYGDLDLSVIDEMPKNRKKTITKLITPQARKKVYEFIRNEIKKGRQAFVICPKIEPSKTISNWTDVKAVEEEYEKLKKEIFPDLKIEMLHGRMKSKEKQAIMKKFNKGKTDILVSTSVIEVGIDVKNATIMIIEGAEKFGLAQLHQFRGRIGRGKEQSYCFLFTSSKEIRTTRRLQALLKSENGFELAEKDLAIRGPGELSGARQWGIPDLVMASLSDVGLLEQTRHWAKETLKKDPFLENNNLLKKELEKFGKRIHLE